MYVHVKISHPPYAPITPVCAKPGMAWKERPRFILASAPNLDLLKVPGGLRPRSIMHDRHLQSRLWIIIMSTKGPTLSRRSSS